MKIVLVTGASSGVGKAVAELLTDKQCRVYGASRSAVSHNRFISIPIDVRDNQSVQQAVDYVLEREDRIDVLINNAGIGVAGSIEDTPIEDAQDLFETNFFGVVRLANSVVPVMRKQKCGLIINISSLAGKIGLPFQGFYSASKFAIEGFSESLRMELKPFNIQVVAIQLGDLATNFTQNRKIPSPALMNESAYRHKFSTALSCYESDEKAGLRPEDVAQLLHKIIKSKRPKANYSFGLLSQKLAPRLKAFMPDALFRKGLMAYYRIN